VISCAGARESGDAVFAERRAASVALVPLACWFFLPLLAIAVLPAADRDAVAQASPSPASAPRVSAVRSGNVPTHDGMRLTLTADTGSIRIFTDASGEVRYRVIVEAEASDPAAGKRLERFSLTKRATPTGVALSGQMPGPHDLDRVWVTYEIHVPRRYSLEISTQAGDITTQDIDGQVALSTGGGNIQAGNIGDVREDHAPIAQHRALVARLDTAGGHILVGNVAGSLRAATAGGHIIAGNVDGDAILQTGGGHLHVGRVAGAAQLSTGGGDIVAERADDGATAETGGGRIEFGEAAGVIQARTAGGGVRIDRVAGPTQLNSNDGGILLTGVQAPLHASTKSGSITAWFSPQFGDADSPGAPDAARSPTPSELASVQGDIIVYLPRQTALTIDAVVEHGSGRNIVADPSVPLRVSYVDSAGGRALRGECDLNGGGKVLHLRTASGNIQLRFLDPDAQQRLAAQHDPGLAMESDQTAGISANGMVVSKITPDGTAIVAPSSSARGSQATGGADANAPSAFEELRRRFESLWLSEISIAAGEQQSRLVHSVAPEYPEIARRAGVEGDVTLRVVIGKDGAVEDVAPISGEPVLTRAAMEAVERWRYSPEMVGGRPIGVVTTVTVAFRLR
jgi:TonB family protein